MRRESKHRRRENDDTTVSAFHVRDLLRLFADFHCGISPTPT
jgi:hypothetical protein